MTPKLVTRTIDKRELDSWGLSEATTEFLLRSPELASAVAEARKLPPFPENYEPRILEVFFDDVPFIRVENGQVVYSRDCTADYEPPCSEFAFDEETALFQVRGEVVINRVERMQLSAISKLMGVLHGR